MRKFETLLLLSPELAADAREALLGTFTGASNAPASVHRGSLGYARPRLPCPQSKCAATSCASNMSPPATPWPNSETHHPHQRRRIQSSLP